MNKFIYRVWGCFLLLVFLFVIFLPSTILGFAEFIVSGKHAIIDETNNMLGVFIDIINPD
ncbi:MAG: hypothetical protein MSA19_01965 [Butyricimonas virosa]|uniref:hypothetical protein n=1 Tax=Butyricimonas virosa TaxID=544645 RepID=UPI0022E52AED|nr:hypothetical protein [Butyricimonas virosa]MCI7162150.1 hypothetical protein [Butyricimonas virosa]MDY5013785.1 hypothetical protein [Butyricimonas virosa]